MSGARRVWTKEVDVAMSKGKIPPDELRSYVAKWIPSVYKDDEAKRVSDNGYTHTAREYWIAQICIPHKSAADGFKYIDMQPAHAVKMYPPDALGEITDPAIKDDKGNPVVDGRVLLYVRKPRAPCCIICPVPGKEDQVVDISKDEHARILNLPTGAMYDISAHLSAIVIDHKLPEEPEVKKKKTEEYPYTSLPTPSAPAKDSPTDIERKEILAHLNKTAKYHTVSESGATIVVAPIKD